MPVFHLPESLRKASMYQVLIFSLLVFAACSRDARQYLAAGEKYIAEGKYSAAAIELKNAVQADPALVEARYQLAIAYVGMGQLPAADDALAEAVSRDPNHIAAQLLQGNVLLLLREFVSARTNADRILNIEPKNTRAQILLANALDGIIDLNDSIDQLRRTVDVGPALVPGYLDLEATPGFLRQP